jgi:cell division protein FtsL
MTGADNARQFEERLARSSRAVAFWSAVGALLILSALVYSGFHLRRVQKKTQEAEASLKAKQAELEAKQAELKEVDARLTKAKQTADIYGLTLNTVSIKSPEETAAAFKRAVSQVPGAAGITIQIASKSQLAKAKEIAGRLRDLGYEVPPDEAIEIRGVHISNENYVRYFFKSDEDLARQIANQIKAMGIDVQPFSLVGEPDLGEVHPRTFEFRLGRKYNP